MGKEEVRDFVEHLWKQIHWPMLSTPSAAVPGLYSFTITGASGSLTSQLTVALNIRGTPTFTLSATPAVLNLQPGVSGTTTIALAREYGFTGAPTLSVSGLPAGVVSKLSSGSVSTSCALTLAIAPGATLGQSAITVTGTSGTLIKTVTITLNVAAPNVRSAVSLRAGHAR